MAAPRFSLTADRNAPPVALRFNDPDFLDALERDESDDSGDVKRPLAGLLGLKRAADFDVAPYVEAGLTIYAREAVPGAAEKRLYTDARHGDDVDIVKFNASRWALWVTGLAVNDDVEWERESDRKAFALLASSDKAKRLEGYNLLERRMQDILTCRVRVHMEQAGRPAERDSGKASGATSEDF